MQNNDFFNDDNKKSPAFAKIIAAIVTLTVLLVLTIVILPRVMKKPGEVSPIDSPTGTEISGTVSLAPTEEPAVTVQPTPGQISDVDVYVDTDITTDTIDDYVAKTISGNDLTYLLSSMTSDYVYLVTYYDYHPEVGDRIFMVQEATETGSYARQVKRADGLYTTETFVNTGRQIDGPIVMNWDSTTHQFLVAGSRRMFDVGKVTYDEGSDIPNKDISLARFEQWDGRSKWSGSDTFYIWEVYSTEEEEVIGYAFEPTTLEFK